MKKPTIDQQSDIHDLIGKLTRVSEDYGYAVSRMNQTGLMADDQLADQAAELQAEARQNLISLLETLGVLS